MIFLGVVCVLLVAFLAYRERQTVAERKELLDRIQAPHAVQTAMFQEMYPDAPPPPALPTEPSPESPDLRLLGLMED